MKDHLQILPKADNNTGDVNQIHSTEISPKNNMQFTKTIRRNWRLWTILAIGVLTVSVFAYIVYRHIQELKR